MHQINKVRDWCPSSPLPPTFQVRRHDPDHPQPIHCKCTSHIWIKNVECLSMATLNIEVQISQDTTTSHTNLAEAHHMKWWGGRGNKGVTLLQRHSYRAPNSTNKNCYTGIFWRILLQSAILCKKEALSSVDWRSAWGCNFLRIWLVKAVLEIEAQSGSEPASPLLTYWLFRDALKRVCGGVGPFLVTREHG